MAVSVGARLGPYEILGLLGAGGMGEVYRANDTRLQRLVAIKVLPAALSADPERRSRFEREAKAIAALAHPHICTLFDVGNHQGIEFLVMELIEGETLAARLERGPLSLPEALTRLIEIAEALDAAHRLGCVHRDLKPANVMLTKSGAKLLDFGLAKLRAGTDARIEGLTDTAPLTGQGQILGTLQYIAPEQLEGKAADERADLFSFGAIAFEMVTGKRAFAGSNAASVIGAVMHVDPPAISQLQPGVPAAFERLIAICLSKDPEGRWSSAHDVILQLRMLDSAPGPLSASGGTSRPKGHERLAWTAAILAAAMAVGLAIVMLFFNVSRPAESARDTTALSILPPAETALVAGEAPQIAPDGRHLAFVATERSGRTQLYVRSLTSFDSRPLPGTDGAALPFWSPDSRQLGFFAQGQLKTISISGGSANSLAAAPVPRGGAWSREDIILFIVVPSQPLYQIPASGGEATPVPVRGEGDRRWFPSFLPDGRHYLYLAVGATSEDKAPNSLYVGSLDSSETQELLQTRWSASYVDPGYVLFRRESDLMAQRFDAQTLELGGEAMRVAEDVGFNAITYQALFSASDSGVLTFLATSAWSELVWFDRRGARLAREAPAAQYTSLCLTADEQKVVFDVADPISGSVDVWAQSLGDGSPVRLTFDPAVDFFVVCSRTRQELIFASLREGPPNLFRMSVATPGSEQIVLRTPAPKVPTDWSGDGQLVVYSVLRLETNMDIEILKLADGSTEPFAATRANERSARLSPDMRWLAYVSNETGSDEVYVQPYPATGAKWQISPTGGIYPQWRRDGQELFYLAPDKSLIGVAIRVVGPDLVPGESVALVDTHATGSEPNGQGLLYAVADHGERFLVSSAKDTSLPIAVIENWQARLDRDLDRMPVDQKGDVEARLIVLDGAVVSQAKGTWAAADSSPDASRTPPPL